MSEAAVGDQLIRFGPFELDVAEKRLRKHGSRIKLQGQPFRVLCRLVENPQSLVSREALRQELWPEDTFVDFDHSLNEAVNKLRMALGDSATSPRYVETVPRHGYRFISDVERIAKKPPTPESRSRRPRAYVAAAAGVGVVVLAGSVLLHSTFSSRESLPERSIAVLPFDNLSGNPDQDYFAEGMTDEIIAHLSKVEALRVISRASVLQYRGSTKPPSTIGRELGVDHVIEGTVRLTGDRVRVTVHMDEVATSRSLWTEMYEGGTGDILQIQDRAARAIATNVLDELSAEDRERLAPRAARDPAAYEAYLKGRHHWNQRTDRGFARAIELFRRAIALEPDYAEAYAGLADAYSLRAVYNIERPRDVMPLAKDAASEAIRLDPKLAQAHTSLGQILFLYEWDWEGAEREFRTALRLSPGHATTHQWYGVFLVAQNRTDEALVELHRALERDPLSLAVNENLGWALYVARRYEDAIEQLETALDLDPEFGQALRYLGLTYLHLGRRPEALVVLERAEHALEGESEVTADLALAYALVGDDARAEVMLEELLLRSETSYVSPYLIASFHTGLGNTDEALDWLERAYEERIANLVFLGVDPFFDPLRAEPRFLALVERIGGDGSR